MIRSAPPAYTARLFMRAQPEPGQLKGFWHRWDAEPAVPTETHPTFTVEAFVAEGRWLVQCPACNGAQLASREDRRFFCIDCLNDHAGGAWVRVVWPDDEAEIEAVLSARPAPNRNWRPGETVDGLVIENRDHHLAQYGDAY